jgi:predicted nucleic acid-binding protein
VADQLKRVAVDTCVILDLLIDEDADLAARAHCVLDGHGDRHTIVIPAIVIPEIAGTGNVRGTHLPKAVRAERMKAATDWIRSSNFVVAEMSERTARRAAEVAVRHNLKGPDAAVLATADEWGCQRLYTRDDALLGCDAHFGFKIGPADDPPEPEMDLFTETS